MSNTVNPTGTAALDQLHDLIARARKAGADAADAMWGQSTSLSISWRTGALESLEQAESGDLGLRVFVGKRQALVSTTDMRPATREEMVTRAVAMAKAAPEDAFCGIADESQISRSWPQIEMADEYKISSEELIGYARQAEAGALAVDGVSMCESTDAGASDTTVSMVCSNGFAGTQRRTYYSLSATVLAGEGTAMERDYDYRTTAFKSDMPSAEAIGKHAAERTVRRLGARKMPTQRVPIVYEPRVAAGIVGHLAEAISGSGIARGTSFLKDSMGQKIFSDGITIVDDPLRVRGLRSRLFDGEGIAPQQRNLIDSGMLTGWLLDLRSARQLGLKSTGNASRSPSGQPHPSAHNLYLKAGKTSAADLIKDIKQGFYVTDLMGMGVNSVTGDYSRAASGFWIENGVLAFPVNEVTIAGNLKEMFLNLHAADDLRFDHGVDSPTLRVEGMTVAGV